MQLFSRSPSEPTRGETSLELCGAAAQQCAQAHEPSLSPLVVCLSWLVLVDPREDLVAKYAGLYTSRNCDVLWVPTTPLNIGIPASGRKSMLRVIKEVNRLLAISERPLIFHVFSAGSYLFGELWNFIHERQDVNKRIMINMCGLIADSPIDVVDSSRGVAGVVTGNTTLGKELNFPILYSATRAAAWTYLQLTHPATQAYHQKSAETVRHLSVKVPVLIFYSEDDGVALAKNVRNIVENEYREAGLDMVVVCFEKSVHAQHLRVHPEKYTESVGALVDRSVLYWKRARHSLSSL